jgi:hypothetical protein
VPKPRVPTRQPKPAIERRLAEKKRRQMAKRLRTDVRANDE